MSKKIKVKKFYTGLSQAEIDAKNKLTLICSIITVVAAIVIPCLPMQRGISFLNEKYGFIVYSVCMILWAACAIDSVYCLIAHFTLYKIRAEIYENQKPALKGDWHTFGGIEIQLVLSGISLLAEFFLLVRWFDWQTLFASVIAACGFAAAFMLRKTTFEAFKNLSEQKPESSARKNSEEKAEESPEQPDQSEENEEVSDFYDKD